ncbi:hypothetical protein PHYPSEUDO_013804 [Phytophthora pseudosyringae]|uniref:Uncharacterized protein n=1 Tax=Phytophthora pseudosyringae TaxID=221518 RepID=A0A8T1W233_9STRA|nr:hypothetical protein PHYPSEUDO_013804 [Phytophthora pseudosyringae]
MSAVPTPSAAEGALMPRCRSRPGLALMKVPASRAARREHVIRRRWLPRLPRTRSRRGGGSQGSPGLDPAGAVAHVLVATAGPEGDSSVPAEQPTVYVPVAAYPPTPTLTAPPDLSTATEATYHDDEESKPEAPTSRKSEISRSTEAEVAEHALRVAQQQVADLQAAISARDDQERARLQAYEQAVYVQAAEQEMNR